MVAEVETVRQWSYLRSKLVEGTGSLDDAKLKVESASEGSMYGNSSTYRSDQPSVLCSFCGHVESSWIDMQRYADIGEDVKR